MNIIARHKDKLNPLVFVLVRVRAPDVVLIVHLFPINTVKVQFWVVLILFVKSLVLINDRVKECPVSLSANMMRYQLLIPCPISHSVVSKQDLDVAWVIFHLTIEEALNAKCKIHSGFSQVECIVWCDLTSLKIAGYSRRRPLDQHLHLESCIHHDCQNDDEAYQCAA